MADSGRMDAESALEMVANHKAPSPSRGASMTSLAPDPRSHGSWGFRRPPGFFYPGVRVRVGNAKRTRIMN
jgi:hypothetical protein